MERLSFATANSVNFFAGSLFRYSFLLHRQPLQAALSNSLITRYLLDRVESIKSWGDQLSKMYLCKCKSPVRYVFHNARFAVCQCSSRGPAYIWSGSIAATNMKDASEGVLLGDKDITQDSNRRCFFERLPLRLRCVSLAINWRIGPIHHWQICSNCLGFCKVACSNETQNWLQQVQLFAFV